MMVVSVIGRRAGPIEDGPPLEARVALERRAGDRQRAALVIDGAAQAVERRISYEGRAGDGRRASVVVDRPAIVVGGVLARTSCW